MESPSENIRKLHNSVKHDTFYVKSIAVHGVVKSWARLSNFYFILFGTCKIHTFLML